MTSGTPRLAPGEVVRIRAERWRVTAHVPFGTCAFVDVDGAEPSNNGRRARFVWPFEPIERLIGDTRPLVVRPPRWRRIACAQLGDAQPSPLCLKTAASAEIALMPFQLEPALAVTHGLTARLLISDAVGLGKTIQSGLVIAEVLARVRDGHAFVVTPAGLREQWMRELRSRFAIDAEIADATTIASADSQGNPWARHSAVIASIDYVKRPEILRGLEEMVWDVVVFDEAHWLTGHSDRAKAASEIAARGRVVVALTATPHGGDEAAFTRLCDLGRLHGEGPIAFFRRTRRDTGLVEMRRMRWLNVTPTPVERRMHEALASYGRAVWNANLSSGARLAMIVLARRACSSPRSLVRSLERRLDLLANDIDGSFQLRLPLESLESDAEPATALGVRGLADAAREHRHLDEVLSLARLACHDESKLRRLNRLLARTREPAIVFTEYRDTLEHLADVLKHLAPAQLHGEMTLNDRRDCIRRFTSGSARVLLATDAGSEGLNLHHRCRLVVNLEVPWTPLRLEQRIGRVDRIGQQRRVHAVQMIARGTPEDRVLHQLIDREWRARASLDAIAHLDVIAVGQAAIGGDAVAQSADAASHAGRVTTVDVRAAAIEETQRLELARRLLRNGGVAVHRPAITVLSRGDAAARAYWAYVLTLLGPDGEWLWQSVVAVTHPMPARTLSGPDDVRRVINQMSDPLAASIEPAAICVQSTFLAATQAPIACAEFRERAIQQQIATRRSTMAAALVQRGLFDAREERRTAADTARLNAALDKCSARLGALQQMRTISGHNARLAFALLR